MLHSMTSFFLLFRFFCLECSIIITIGRMSSDDYVSQDKCIYKLEVPCIFTYDYQMTEKAIANSKGTNTLPYKYM